MSEARWIQLSKGICGLFGLIILLQFLGWFRGSDPLEEVNIEYYSGLLTPSKDEAADAKPGSPSTIPELVVAQLAKIESSGVFGKAPQPPPYVLEGFVGDTVLIQIMGQSKRMKVGEEANGIKILRIENNRVLIEHENREQELNIFSGLGSAPLVGAGKEKK